MATYAVDRFSEANFKRFQNKCVEEIKNLHTEIGRLKVENEELKKEAENSPSSNKIISNLRAEIRRLKRERAALQGRLNIARMYTKMSEEERRMQRNEVDHLESELKDLKQAETDLVARQSAQIAELLRSTVSVREHEQIVSELRDRITEHSVLRTQIHVAQQQLGLEPHEPEMEKTTNAKSGIENECNEMRQKVDKWKRRFGCTLLFSVALGTCAHFGSNVSWYCD
ncbi:unnamed protein product [Caenorhabditis sp. 36 PRJEB53466]|nr:unnamed protein product [Caenorhabditis sp. 36 PRJEB53466]